MDMCDIHTQMVCQHQNVLKMSQRGQYDAIKHVIDDEDTITLRCLCKWASNDMRLCRDLSILMCYSVDANKLNSFRCLLLHIPECKYPMYYEFGKNTVGVWALIHSAARFRPHHLDLLIQKHPYTGIELAVADKIAQHYGQGWVSAVLKQATSQSPMPTNNLCPYRCTPFEFGTD